MAVYNCDECENFEYDEEWDTYSCIMDLDMDDFERFAFSGHGQCPYFRVRDEYRIVRKQN